MKTCYDVTILDAKEMGKSNNYGLISKKRNERKMQEQRLFPFLP